MKLYVGITDFSYESIVMTIERDGNYLHSLLRDFTFSCFVNQFFFFGLQLLFFHLVTGWAHNV